MTEKEISNSLLTNQSFPINLFHYYNQQTERPFFRLKKQQTGIYPELEIFRQQIEIEKNGHYQLPYSNVKRKVFTYKSIFMIFGLLFFLLGSLIYMKAVYWSFGHFSYNEFFIVKNLAVAFCGFIGSVSLWIARTMRTEIEAANQVLRRAKYKLGKVFARKKIEYGIQGLLTFGKKYEKSQALKHAYYEACDKFMHRYENLNYLFKRINHSSLLNAQTREHLYNQAILEFGDLTKEIIRDFKKG